jgi:hypothetical protein
MPRKMPTGRAGNYAAPVDTAGMDPAMKASLQVTPTEKMDKVESAYVKGKGGASSALQAVRKARKANKRPPLPED